MAVFLKMGNRPSNTPWTLQNISQMMYNICYGQAARMPALNTEGVYGYVCPPSTTRFFAHNPIEVLVWRLYYAVGDHATIPTNAPTGTFVGTDSNTYTYYIDNTYTGEISFLTTDEYDFSVTLKGNGSPVPLKNTNYYDVGNLDLSGGVVFDISSITRDQFTRIDDLKNMPSVNAVAECTDMLMRAFLMNGADYAFVQDAVAQIGEPSVQAWDGVQLLSKQVEIRKWVNATGVSRAVPEVTLMFEQATGDYAAHKAYRIPITTQAEATAVNTLLGTQKIRFTDGICAGVGVKWRNKLGGVDYFVFNPKAYETRKVKTDGTQFIPQTEIEYMKGNRRAYSITESRTLRLGTDALEDDTYKALLWLPYASEIMVYDEEKAMWIEVVLETFENKAQSDVRCKAFDIELRLPDINTQF